MTAWTEFMPEWLTFSVVKDVVLALIAGYAAIVSTMVWRHSVRKDRRSVQVSFSTAMPTYNDGRVGDCYLQLEVVNTGHRTVTITMMALELRGRKRMFPVSSAGFPGVPNTPMPATLADGQSAHMYMSYREIGEALIESGRTSKVKIRPVCKDSAGNTYKGEAWRIDPAEYTRM